LTYGATDRMALSRREPASSPASDEEAEARVGFRSYLIYLAIAFGLAVALSWSYTTTARLGFEINSAKSEIGRLRAEHERLGCQLAGFQALARVEREALRLGMVRPEYVRTGVAAEAVIGSGNGAPIAAVGRGAGGDPASGGSGATARIITLTPGGELGPPGNSVSSTGAIPGGGHVSLWDRFYRWLTGVSQAEAREWQ
jgi:hypothetical protein